MTLIALIDGPLPEDQPALAGRLLLRGEAPPGSAGAAHALAMAGAILAGAPDARLLSIAVLGAQLTTDAATLARGFAAASEAAIVHCSLGLTRETPEIAAALDALLAKGRLIVASAPARGGPVWPAAHPGVIAVQGDARCGPGEWSHLALPNAEFGACPRLPSGIAGASVGAAHFTGLLAARGGDLAVMRESAAYKGRERRVSP